ncbi:MAG: hypothetical protein ACI9VR_002393 [Cognaticolwellia sp.]|jgi:hypothetical protein
MNISVLYASPSALPRVVPSPFCVLLDADDSDWSDDPPLISAVRALLRAGCRYFVCFGSNSENIHDRIDDVIVDGRFCGVTTTWHEDESEKDVAEFFQNCATIGMRASVILVRDQQRWSVAFSAI